jgi:hypothetical protein
MSALEGSLPITDVRASLRAIPGILHIWGGEGERDNPPGDQDQDPPEGDDVDNDEDAGDDSDNDNDSDEDSDSKKKKGKSLEEQLDDERRARAKLERQIAREKKAAEDAEADKDVAKDRDKYKAKVEARDKFLTENLLQIEVLKQTKYNFVDVEDVVVALQRDEDVHVDLDADIPSVEGLDIALKRLAKKKPHWLKGNEQEPNGQPSGDKSGGGSNGSAEAEAAALGKKYKIPGFGMQAVRPV